MTTSNKCPNCSGELVFDIESQKLKCTHCSTFQDFESSSKKLEKQLLTAESTIKKSKTEYTQYACQTCGRKHICATDTPLTRCPSCGSDNLTKTVKIDYTPDGIIPFKIDKENALAHFSSWLKTRKFTPNSLKRLAKSKVMDGFYLPAYFYDFECTTHYSGVGINTVRSPRGDVRTVRHSFNKVRNDKYVNRIESASSAISSMKMEQLGGFSENKILVYRTEYLYGFFGGQVDSFVQDNSQNMKRTVTQELAFDVRAKLPYERIENFSCNTDFSNIFYSYVYLPVYKGFYNYKKRNYYYYINGENGKVTGKTPKSFWKILLVVLGVGALVALFIYLYYKSH
jgi:DNA-directed RNA polymerase subunit RPC12/RpoP